MPNEGVDDPRTHTLTSSRDLPELKPAGSKAEEPRPNPAPGRPKQSLLSSGTHPFIAAFKAVARAVPVVVSAKAEAIETRAAEVRRVRRRGMMMKMVRKLLWHLSTGLNTYVLSSRTKHVSWSTTRQQRCCEFLPTRIREAFFSVTVTAV